MQNEDNVIKSFLNEVEKMNTLYQNNNKIIDKLIASIKNDIADFKKKFEEKEITTQRNLLSQQAESLNENVNKYRDLYNKIKEKEFENFNILSEKCKELKKIENKIRSEGNIFEETEKIILFSYKVPDKKLETFYKYFDDSKNEDTLLKIDKREKILGEKKVKYEKTYFYNINDHLFNLKKNEIKSTKIKEIKIEPKIIINGEELDEDFEKSNIIKNFNKALQMLDNLLKNISKNKNNIKYSKSNFENLNIKFKNINFSSPKIDDDKPEETVEICHKIDLFKNDILNLLDNILNKYNKIQNIAFIINQDKKIIPKDFDLLDLNINIVDFDKYKLGFSDKINKINISSPYLFILMNQIHYNFV